MIETRCEIESALTQPLEDFFCEFERSPWMIFHDAADGNARDLLMGYFDSEAEALDAWADLRKVFKVLPARPSIGTLEDRDWKEAYKQNLHPWNYGRLRWIPDWQRATCRVPADAAVVYFDAGLAFGTGDHPTTRLCARRLVDFLENERGGNAEAIAGTSVIDAGCGSGILALSAAKLGCANVFGFDRDPDAVAVSIENRAKNAIPPNAAKFTHDGLDTGLACAGAADVVLANIISDVLCLHADALVASVKPGGMLALSGILAVEQPTVRRVFEAKARAAWGENCVRADGRTAGEWSDVALFRT